MSDSIESRIKSLTKQHNKIIDRFCPSPNPPYFTSHLWYART